MATKPGILTSWPWAPLGNYKYVVLAPWVAHSMYKWFMVDVGEKRDLANFIIFPIILWRMLHNQLWISLSRYQIAKGNNMVVDKAIEFEQVDRERSWDDHIIFNGLIFYTFNSMVRRASYLPLWRSDGIMITMLMHMGPVELLYYWFHRALHHHYLYSRYHSHHHYSIVTEPITSVIHPFAEHIAYHMIFAIPFCTTVVNGTASIAAFIIYITYVDFMNNMGHCNFEIIPKCLFSYFPPLKYLFYTTSYHSLHHTQYRTNYSLFMPIYDYIYGTMDKSTDELYETSLKKSIRQVDVVHLTHLTTPNSIYHLGFGFSSLASNPYTCSPWYMWLMWPFTLWSMILTWAYGRSFVVERHQLDDKLTLQTWVVPKYSLQYFLHRQNESINKLIENTILDANEKGVRVLSLGLLNQGDELNKNGEMYVKKHPNLKVKVVDGSSLAVAVVLNNIPKETTQVVLRGHLTKVAFAVAFSLCQKGLKVTTMQEDEYKKLKKYFNGLFGSNLILSRSFSEKGDELNKNGEMYVKKHPNLKVKVVDGSSLAVAVVLNNIPKETTQVVLRGHLTKVAFAVAFSLCQKGLKVTTMQEDEYKKLKKYFNGLFGSNLILSRSFSEKVWVVGDGLTEEQQLKAPKGTIFIPFSQFPIEELRKDCIYHHTPAMETPPSLANVHSCENWLPRRVMSAWRVAGIVHALEGWDQHECEPFVTNIDKVWKTSIGHGFQPLKTPTTYQPFNSIYMYDT